MAILKVDTISGIGTEGPVFEGDIEFTSQNFLTLPKGDTTQRGRGRGIIAGGSPGTDNNEQIEFINIQSDGNAVEFGNTSMKDFKSEEITRFPLLTASKSVIPKLSLFVFKAR